MGCVFNQKMTTQSRVAIIIRWSALRRIADQVKPLAHCLNKGERLFFQPG